MVQNFVILGSTYLESGAGFTILGKKVVQIYNPKKHLESDAGFLILESDAGLLAHI